MFKPSRLRHNFLKINIENWSVFDDIMAKAGGLRSVSTTAALRCALRAIVSDSQRYR